MEKAGREELLMTEKEKVVNYLIDWGKASSLILIKDY